MLTIEKTEVATWLLLSFKSEKSKVNDKIDLFQRKYNHAFMDFEKFIKNLNAV